ncbi:putative RTA1 domain protein [Massariosphaeria phaeospora]|uniref:Putative RTA1 domain protein n=1 Tax=Massariosphaeria phaeospora TaxID=100035 RepID=A0A7C8MV18_9PLEO|nr:putative RTA1 domain protein [Massariosphaeria phaeospora]
MSEGEPVPGSLYIYAPNKVAPIFFAIAFALSAIGHTWQCYHYKSWKLIGLHPLCAWVFTLGYALREYGAFNYIYKGKNLVVLMTFILSQVFIYVCPPLLELANYHVLGRALYYVPFLAPLPPGKVLSTFGAVMLFVEILNSVGVSLAANPSSSETTQHLGSVLTITAISLQLVVILIFVTLAVIFHFRLRQANIHNKGLSRTLKTLHTSMALIFIRCIYRLIEHMGHTSVDLKDIDALRNLTPILRYEWFFYIFEASLMLVNSVIWNVWNPARYLPRHHNIRLATDGATEIHGEEEKDERPLWAQIASALTFGLLFRKKYHQAC